MDKSFNNWVNIGPVLRFPHRHVVDGRSVAVYKYEDTLYCIDANCWHGGGSLTTNDDIEDIQGHPCVTCPMHGYIISLVNGENFHMHVIYQQEGNRQLKVEKGWSSNGYKQRVHDIDQRGEDIYVRLTNEGTFQSDEYAFIQDKEHNKKRWLGLRRRKLIKPDGGDVRQSTSINLGKALRH